MKILVYNPYKINQLPFLLLHYRSLKGSFSKRFLFKRFAGNEIYLYAADFINRVKTLQSRLNQKKLFRIIEIETINRCNNSCHFCPANAKTDTRLFQKMTRTLFEKIINELAHLKYCGTIFFHSNNEPLLDEDLESKIGYARIRCPKAYLSFYTNGKLLTPEMIQKFGKAGIDKITINNYCNDLHLNQHIEELLTKIRSSAPNKNISTYDDFLFLKSSPCYLPFREIIIRPDGKVSLCSNDACGKKTMGDVNSDDLETIWFGEAFRETRQKLVQNKRYELAVCNRCDK
jgi:radical SAM protein with 4Fe4S-binding SPASM domain